VNRAQINDTVRSVLNEVVNNEAVFAMSESSSLREDIGLDSMSSLMFLVAIEQALSFTIDPSTLDASDFETIDSICTYIETQKMAIAL
jgi:acyl carrier protein